MTALSVLFPKTSVRPSRYGVLDALFGVQYVKEGDTRTLRLKAGGVSKQILKSGRWRRITERAAATKRKRRAVGGELTERIGQGFEDNKEAIKDFLSEFPPKVIRTWPKRTRERVKKDVARLKEIGPKKYAWEAVKGFGGRILSVAKPLAKPLMAGGMPLAVAYPIAIAAGVLGSSPASVTSAGAIAGVIGPWGLIPGLGQVEAAAIYGLGLAAIKLPKLPGAIIREIRALRKNPPIWKKIKARSKQRRKKILAGTFKEYGDEPSQVRKTKRGKEGMLVLEGGRWKKMGSVQRAQGDKPKTADPLSRFIGGGKPKEWRGRGTGHTGRAPFKPGAMMKLGPSRSPHKLTRSPLDYTVLDALFGVQYQEDELSMTPSQIADILAAEVKRLPESVQPTFVAAVVEATDAGAADIFEAIEMALYVVRKK